MGNIRGYVLLSKLEKNFLLEKRYDNDKRDMKILLMLSIIMPIYLLIYFPMIYFCKKYYQKICRMRDEQREIELLQIIESTKYKTKKYFYAFYALADLDNQQIKDIVVNKILALDDKKFLGDGMFNETLEYGRILAYLVQKENNSF